MHLHSLTETVRGWHRVTVIADEGQKQSSEPEEVCIVTFVISKDHLLMFDGLRAFALTTLET